MPSQPDECLGPADDLGSSFVYHVPDDPAPLQVDAVDVDVLPAQPSFDLPFSRCIDSKLTSNQHTQLVALLDQLHM